MPTFRLQAQCSHLGLRPFGRAFECTAGPHKGKQCPKR